MFEVLTSVLIFVGRPTGSRWTLGLLGSFFVVIEYGRTWSLLPSIPGGWSVRLARGRGGLGVNWWLTPRAGTPLCSVQI
jgi:hypothetical protein